MPETGTTYARYSDRERDLAVAAVSANHGNVTGTAAQLGIPEPTLRQWVNGRSRPANPVDLSVVKEGLARSFERVARRMIKQASRKVKDMSGGQAVLGAAIATDKMLLLRGEATSITEHRDDARLAELAARYAARAPTLLPPSTPAQPLQIQPTDPPAPSPPPPPTTE